MTYRCNYTFFYKHTVENEWTDYMRSSICVSIWSSIGLHNNIWSLAQTPHWLDSSLNPLNLPKCLDFRSKEATLLFIRSIIGNGFIFWIKQPTICDVFNYNILFPPWRARTDVEGVQRSKWMAGLRARGYIHHALLGFNHLMVGRECVRSIYIQHVYTRPNWHNLSSICLCFSVMPCGQKIHGGQEPPTIAVLLQTIPCSSYR